MTRIKLFKTPIVFLRFIIVFGVVFAVLGNKKP